MDSFDRLTPADYEAKLDQFDAELSGARSLGEAMAAGCDPLDRAARAGEEEHTERMERLERDAMDAFAECDRLADQFGIGQ